VCLHLFYLAQVSSWKLAREVARAGELGVVSGTAMDVVLLRWLQDGDPGNLYRNALKSFPDQGMAQRFIDKYYVEGGKAAEKPYAPLQMWQLDASQALREACVLGNYCEVRLPPQHPISGQAAVWLEARGGVSPDAAARQASNPVPVDHLHFWGISSPEIQREIPKKQINTPVLLVRESVYSVRVFRSEG